MAPLPILIAPEFAFSVKLTLKTSENWQYQSILTRLLKIAAWNELNGDELAYVFGSEVLNHHSLLKQPPDFLWRKFRHYFKDSNKTLTQAFPPFLKPLDEVKAAQIRGCQRCYQIGFHSPLYQLTFLECCPIHNEPIVEGCPHCFYPVPYAITSQLRRQGFRCQHCDMGIINLGENTVWNGPELYKLSIWRALLSKAFPKRACKRKSTLSCHYPSNWIEALGQWNLYYGEIPKLPAITIIPKFMVQRLEAIGEYSIYGDADSTYYWVRRIHRHRLSKIDQQRYNELTHMFQKWLIAPSTNDIRVISYLMWRIAWEKSFAFELPNASLKGGHIPVAVSCWILSQPSLGSDEILRQFYQELWCSYLRCQWLAHWMQKKGGVLMGKNVLRLIVPHLCIRPLYKK